MWGREKLLVLLIAVALVLSLSVGTSERQLERVAYKSGSEAAVDTGVSKQLFRLIGTLESFLEAGSWLFRR